MKATKLRKARALIADEKNWCQNTFARDCHGEEVDPKSCKAASFCAVGAAIRVGGEYSDLADVGYSLGYLGAASLNDGHGWLGAGRNPALSRDDRHDLVLWAYDLAIAIKEVGE